MRWLRALAIITVIGAGFWLGAFWLLGNDPINKANFDKLGVGMSREEVEGILGEAIVGEPDLTGSAQGFWLGENSAIEASFDRHDRILSFQFHQEVPFGWREWAAEMGWRPNLWQQLRSLIGW